MLHDMNGWFLMAKLVGKYSIHSWIPIGLYKQVYPQEARCEMSPTYAWNLWMFVLYVGVTLNPPKEGPWRRPKAIEKKHWDDKMPQQMEG